MMAPATPVAQPDHAVADMNPFLYKAHPLMDATIRLLTDSGAFGFQDAAALLLTYLVLNLPLAALLAYRLRQSVQLRVRLHAAYLLALPATLLDLPIALTLVDDVMHHAFRLEDRFLFLFAASVATALIAALLGAMPKNRDAEPIGPETGLAVSLTLLLGCIPYALALLGLDAWFGIFPAG